jgi:CheY-like chemotaxis protein
MFLPLRCLLVDDDKDDQDIFRMALGDIDKGIKCTCANNSGEALNILKAPQAEAFDYIFLDLNMPRVNGKQCLKEIKKIPGFQHVPVVIYSTSSDPRDRIETKQMGASNFISKPSDIDLLAKMLADIFNQPQ